MPTDPAERRTHKLKTWPGPWHAVRHGDKRWEFRKDDRGFESGDLVELMYYDPADYLPHLQEGPVLTFRIGYILHGGRFGIPIGYCVFSLEGESD